LASQSLLWAHSVRPYNRLQDRAELERGTWNVEPGTWNVERDRAKRGVAIRVQKGFWPERKVLG